jgi:2-dehydro-3-deoxygluconokinase
VPEVVAIGESMVLLVTEPAMPLRAARTFWRSIAGAESNVAIGLCRLGHDAGWIGRVGDDPFGHGILDALRAEGVDTSRAVVDDAAPTGVLIRDRHAERPIHVLYHRRDSAGSRLRTEDVDPDYLAGARILHLTGITPALSATARDAVAHAASVAVERGVAVCLDPNLRLKLWSADEAAGVLAPLVQHTSILMAGADEAMLLAGASDEPAAARWFLDHGAPLVVLKRGARGSWATDGQQEWSSPAFPVTPVDVIGAGDGFAAGFLAAHLEGAPVQRCLETGNASGALCTQVPGDIEGLPYRADLDALLRGGADVDR